MFQCITLLRRGRDLLIRRTLLSTEAYHLQLQGPFGSHIGDYLSVPELVFLDKLHKVPYLEENACEIASASSGEEPCPLRLTDNLVYSESDNGDDVLDDSAED